LAEYLLDELPPLEAQLIDIADEIAYNTADLDDAFEAYLLDFDTLRAEVPVFDAEYRQIEKEYPRGARKLKFNEALKNVLDCLATDLIENTQRRIISSGVQSVDDIRRSKSRLAGFSAEAAAQSASLKKFLNTHVYSDSAIADDLSRSVAALDALFQFFMANPERMPKFYSEAARDQPTHRIVCDYIAGMTDHYLLRQCREFLGMDIQTES
jgi:dGTPase